MTDNYHYHQYGFGMWRITKNILWIWLAWLVFVAIFAWPWLLLIAAVIIGAAILFVGRANERSRRREQQRQQQPPV